jgi:hypothetical protein
MYSGSDEEEDEGMGKEGGNVVRRYVDMMMNFRDVELGEMQNPMQQLVQCVSEIYETLCVVNTPLECFERNQQIFSPPNESESRYRRISNFISDIHTKCKVLLTEKKCTEEDFEKLQGKLSTILSFMRHGHEGYIRSHRQMHITNVRAGSQVGESDMDKHHLDWGEIKLKPHQELIQYYLFLAHTRMLRKYKSELYRPKYVGDVFTFYYEHHSTILEFIYQECSPYVQNMWLFQVLTDQRQNIPVVERWMLNCIDSRLPGLMPDRHVFAFNNGVYDASAERFYLYEKSDEHRDYPWYTSDLPRDTCACNFIPCEFPVREYDDPYQIPTPNFQSILDYQNIPEDACRWCYAFIGRLFFDVGELDNWQVHLMFKGTAGTGKSTLLHLASMLYQDIDVGNIMSDGRKDFGIEHIYEKFLNMCLDLNKKMTSIPQATWNQMVSGEEVTIDRKNKDAVSKRWKAQMAFAGNDYPPWQDQSGNVVRRLVLFLFTRYVENVDPNLEARCRRNLGSFLRKCVKLYLRKVELYGQSGIWDNGVLPEYLWACRREMQAQTNGLQSFLLSEQCQVQAGGTVSFVAFTQLYRKHCEVNRMAYQALTRDFYSSVFTPMNIEVRQAPFGTEDFEAYDGFEGRKYLRGVSLNQ